MERATGAATNIASVRDVAVVVELLTAITTDFVPATPSLSVTATVIVYAVDGAA